MSSSHHSHPLGGKKTMSFSKTDSLYLLMGLLGSPEIKKTAMSLWKDPNFKPDDHIESTLTGQEVDTWLSLTVRRICDVNKLDYSNDPLKHILNSNSTPQEKIKQVSERFQQIIKEQKDPEKREALIESIGHIGKSSLQYSLEKQIEKAEVIRRILACTIITACVTLKIVSVVLATTSFMAQIALIGLVGFAAAKIVAPDATNKVIANMGNLTIPESVKESVTTGISQTGAAIKSSGFVETLQAAAMSCLSNTLLIKNFPRLMEEYKKLTGAELGAQSLVDLAQREVAKNQAPRV